jgi:D-serine deaminase-like pyridoxal phosphate-dependent protein
MSVHERIGEQIKGRPGSREEIPTPALVLDLDAFERNLQKMADHCEANGIRLRPHAKTHKSAEIAKRQMAAGAVGICCAKLAEAEALAARGLEKILLTSPLATKGSIARAVELNDVIEELIIVVDHMDGARDLNEAAKAAGKPQRVLIDIDPGLHRTGIGLDTGFDALAEFIKTCDGLHFMGLQGYAGHLMHEHDADKRRTDSLAVMGVLAEAKARVKAMGLDCPIVTGGGTGTYDIDPLANVLTDLQGGSYIFMDRQYAEVPAGNGFIPFEPSLFVQMTVISVNTPGLVTTDAGFKSFATDADAPLIHAGAPDGAAYFFFGDEQGGIAFAGGPEDSLPRGANVTCIVPHCDPTVNLYDWYHVVRGDELLELWPIDARGCAQ